MEQYFLRAGRSSNEPGVGLAPAAAQAVTSVSRLVLARGQPLLASVVQFLAMQGHLLAAAARADGACLGEFGGEVVETAGHLPPPLVVLVKGDGRQRAHDAEVRPGGVPRPLKRVSAGCSGTRDVMHGLHARPTSSSLIAKVSTAETPPPGHDGAKHSHRGRRTGRLRRRVLAYRAIDLLSTHIPDDPGPGDECLLLVHTRQVVGQVRYRICTDCAQGVITAVVIDERFHSTGLGTRALSHLRSRHPGLTWRSTLSKRTTRALLRRMRILTATPCPHVHQTLSAPAGPILASG
ncbi:hypothetical protein [Streptomyces sp. NPDC088760]|uniref:hypothetical protein n=1 Tax=Streptomyces sp. NPDC088760 TaxID=3365890 RepID=UPI0037F83869